MNDLRTILDRMLHKDDDDGAHIEGDVLIIPCVDCDFAPEPGSKECFRCMVSSMTECGGADRIILRAGIDIEVSGESGKIVRSIASLRRWSSPISEAGRRCRRCSRHRGIVIERLWEGFPDLGFEEAYGELHNGMIDGECENCVRSTMKTLQHIESEIGSIRNRMAG